MKFNYKEIAAQARNDKSEGAIGEELYKSKYLVSHYEKVSNLENDLMRIPTTEEFFFLQTDTAFNAFTFIPLVAKAFPIKELHASTYSLSRKVIEALIEMHDKGQIERITLLVSDSMIKRNPIVIDNLMAMASSRPNVTVLYAWIHAKVCLMQSHEHYFVIEGSGNWSENAQYEQYTFANSKGLYDFRMKLFTESKLKKYWKMTNLIYVFIKFLLGVFAFVFGFMGIAVLFIIALPIAGWNKLKFVFKRVAR